MKTRKFSTIYSIFQHLLDFVMCEDFDIPSFKVDLDEDYMQVMIGFCEDYGLILEKYDFELHEDLEAFVRRVCVSTNILTVFPKKLAYVTVLNFFHPYFSLAYLQDVEPSGLSVERPIPSSERVVHACFHLRNGLYRYYKIIIKPSDIKGAGMGAFALEDIPKRAKCQYKGVAKSKSDMNPLYSWEVQPCDADGNPEKGVLYFLDATSERSNWTRYVNCGPSSASNNMKVTQIYDKIFYVTKRQITAGSEFYIDYGAKYRSKHLHIDDSTY